MGKQRATKGIGLFGEVSAKRVSASSLGMTVASCSFVCYRQSISAGTTGLRVYGTLPVGLCVHNVYIDVNTREQTASAKSVIVGLSGSTNGFLDTVSTASVGPVQGSLVAGSVTLGSLLSEGTAASGRFRRNHLVTGSAATLVSLVTEAQTEFVGDIVIEGVLVG